MHAIEALERLGGVADWSAATALSSRRSVETEVRAGTIVRTTRGKLALPTADVAVRAAQATTGIVSGRSAAAWWGWELKTQPPAPEITVPKDRRLPDDKTRIAFVWADLHPSEIHDGLVTTRERTLIDCLRRLPFDEALAVADSALRHGFPPDLLSAALHARWLRCGHSTCLQARLRSRAKPSTPPDRSLRSRSVGDPAKTSHAQDDAHDGCRKETRPCRRGAQPGARGRLVREARQTSRAAQRCSPDSEMVVAHWLVLRFAWEDVMHDQDWVRGVLRDLAEMAPLWRALTRRAHQRTQRAQNARKAG